MPLNYKDFLAPGEKVRSCANLHILYKIEQSTNLSCVVL